MDRRRHEILTALMKTDNPIPICDLAEKFSVSGRTIRNDLQKIDLWLEQYYYPALIRGAAGVRLDIDGAEKKQFCNKLKNAISGMENISQAQRLRLIELHLLFATGFVTLAQMAEQFSVSRSTIVNDMHDLRQQEAALSVTGYPRKGFRINGEEFALRLRAVNLLTDMVFSGDLLDHLFSDNPQNAPAPLKIEGQNIFTVMQLKTCAQMAIQLESRLSTVWTDRSILQITCALLVCWLRCERCIYGDLHMPKGIAETRDHFIVRSTLRNRRNSFFAAFTSEDIQFTTLFILCADTCNISYFKKENHIQIQLSASRILRCLEQEQKISFAFSDELQDKLCEYLSHAYYRVKYGVQRYRYDSKQHSGLKAYLEVLPQALAGFEQSICRAIPPEEYEEIAAILLEAHTSETSGLNRYLVAIIWGESSISRQTYLSTLMEEFPQIDVMAVITGHHAVRSALPETLDFVIMNRPFPLEGVRQFIVKDTSSAKETQSLRQYLAENPPGPNAGQSNRRLLLQQVLRIASTVCDRLSYEKFVLALAEKTGPIEYGYYRGDTVIMIKDILKPENTCFGGEAGNWEEAVRDCGNILARDGYVTPAFVDAMVSIVEENGPYIVIAPGIAFPHARPEMGAKKLGMSLVKLKKPICFGNEDNDPVQLLIALSATDNSTHLDALAELFEVISNEEKRMRLLAASSAEEVLSLFH